MPASPTRRLTRAVAVLLVALTGGLSVTATAEGWRRPSAFGVSSPTGGEYQVCRDAITFQIHTGGGGQDPTDPPPTDPTPTQYSFTAYAPPFVFDGIGNHAGGRIVAQGTVSVPLQALPLEIDGNHFYYWATRTAQWLGGESLQPGPASLLLEVHPGSTGPFFLGPDAIDDCQIFPTPTPLVTVCRDGKTITIPEDQMRSSDVPGECPEPDVTVCRDGKTIVIPEDQVLPGDVRGKCQVKPTYKCAGKRATIVGTSRANRLRGTSRADVIVGLGGNDKLSGLDGNDRICGGTGNDTAKGGDGNDRVYGEDGNDRLSGASGRDIIKGGSGRDRLNGGPGRDSLSGGPGKDLHKP